jgi:lysozyme
VAVHNTILEGVDTSSYQGAVNWKAVHQQGRKDFAVIKATEALDIVDPELQQSWNECKDAGMIRLAYHFFYDHLDPIRQADFFHEAVKNAGRFVTGDGVVIDVEETSISDASTALGYIIAFVERCRVQINKKVLIYTNADTWKNILGNPMDNRLSNQPLWLANLSAGVPYIRQWPKGPSMVQYSFHGHCPGINAEVDLDRFYGNRAQLQLLLKHV